MGLLEHLKERFRPELPVRQDIINREERFNESDSSRESWLLNHIYLCEGDLDALKKHPDFDAAGQGIDYIIAYYESPQGEKGPCKRVTVNLPLDSDEKGTIDLIERKLKLDLHSRGCNAGVFYQRYKRSNFLYAEAVPATLSGE
jgi:hypothetical protein